jgi:hypothetical protein
VDIIQMGAGGEEGLNEKLYVGREHVEGKRREYEGSCDTPQVVSWRVGMMIRQLSCSNRE